MHVELLAHTQLTKAQYEKFKKMIEESGVTDGKLVAFTAIRNCYSHLKPSEIVEIEGHRYLTKPATDGGNGTEMDRLIRHIIHSGHLSTLEHLAFTFSLEEVTRALLAQLTRHRVGWSYSVESQRYVNYKSEGKSGGFTYTAPVVLNDEQMELFVEAMSEVQKTYDMLVRLGVKAEDARAILPQATNTNIVVTCNIRAFLDFWNKRKPGTHAQGEIKELAVLMKDQIIEVEPWLQSYFN